MPLISIKSCNHLRIILMMRNKTKDRFEDLVSKELNHYFVVSVLQCHLLLIVINFSFVVN